VQRRLEVACQLGPFLPADPSQARCKSTALPALLNGAADTIADALAGPGRCHQWDVVLRWPAESVVASRRTDIARAAQEGGGGRVALAEAVAAALAAERAQREAALRAAVAPVCLALLPAGAGTCETGLTCLMPPGGEAALEAALGALPAAITAEADADMRGPLPPLSFAAVRIDSAAAADIAQAWRTLALPHQVDAAALKQHWRSCAARLHPDRGVTDDAPMVAAGAAFRLLRDLLPPDDRAEAVTLRTLQKTSACRLRVQLANAEAVP
jgi:hypothetical protein